MVAVGSALARSAQSGATRPARLSFPQIDVLRGFAALSVVVYHCIEHYEWTSFPTSGLLLWFRIGWMGVDLFFVISGFVIALSAFSGVDRDGPKGFRRPFMRRRFLRIAPLHYLTCLIYLSLVVPAVLLQSGVIMNLVSHLGFFHNLDWHWAGAINGPNWSIGVEMQFYLLMALLAPLLRTCRWWIVPLAAVAIAWSWRFGTYLMVPIDPEVGPYFRFWTSTQLPGTLDQFACGILLARMFRSAAMADIVESLRRQAWLVVGVAALAVWFALTLFWQKASFWTFPQMIVVWRSLLSVAFALVILAACLLDRPWLLALTAPFRYLGTISYGIYLWHLSVILSVKRLDGIDHGTQLAIVVGLTLLLAAGSWRFFERPFVSST